MLRYFLVLLLVSAPAFAGNETGNGTDEQDWYSMTAWFLGADHSVKYCLAYNPAYDAPYSYDPKSDVQKALRQWGAYVEARQVNKGRQDLTVGDARLTTVFQEVATCTGDEDLTIYIGLPTERVKGYLGGFNSPKGIAIREKFDAVEGWGKGFIWVEGPAPHLSFNASATYGVLLHELGHVFGSQHVPGTIMRPDFALHANSIPGNSIYHQNIDHERELATCFDCQINRKYALEWDSWDVEKKNPIKWVELQGDSIHDLGVLIVDRGKRTTFHFTSFRSSLEKSQNGIAFAALKSNANHFGGTFNSAPMIYTLTGTVEDESGGKELAILESGIQPFASAAESFSTLRLSVLNVTGKKALW